VGVIMLLSGLIHLAWWAVIGESWQGPLSIRKPILFGISTGVTVISMGWILQKLTPTPSDAYLSPLFAAATLIEVGLISMQYWRGTASHFNHATVIDSSVDQVITCLILFAALVILNITGRSFTSLNTTREMKLAIRAGLIFLLISCGLGVFILFYGEHLASLNKAPETFGRAGVLKFPHGVAIHSIQFLPLFVWAMAKLGIDSPQKQSLLMFAIGAIAAMLVFSIVQTFSGRARFDLGFAGAASLTVALLLMVPIGKTIALAVFKRASGKSTDSWKSTRGL
jgi:hypothetical protein